MPDPVTGIIGGASIIGGSMQSRAAGKAADQQAAAADASIAEQRRQFDLIRGDTADYRNIGRNALADISADFGYAPPTAGGAPSPQALPFDQWLQQQGGPGNFGTSGGGVLSGMIGGAVNSRRSYDDYVSNFQPGAPGAATPMPAGRGFSASPDYEFRRGEGMRGIENSFAARGGAASGNALRALTDFNSNLASGEYGNWFNRRAAVAGIGQTATGQSGNAGLATGANIGNALMNAGDARASGIAGSANAWGGTLNDLGGLAGYMYGNRRTGGGGMHAGNWGYGTPPIWGGLS